MPKEITKPYLEYYPPLKEFLDKHGASCLWQKYDDILSIECWLFKNGKAAIIVIYPDNRGWDIYTPSPSLDIEETLVDVEQRLYL